MFLVDVVNRRSGIKMTDSILCGCSDGVAKAIGDSYLRDIDNHINIYRHASSLPMTGGTFDYAKVPMMPVTDIAIETFISRDIKVYANKPDSIGIRLLSVAETNSKFPVKAYLLSAAQRQITIDVVHAKVWGDGYISAAAVDINNKICNYRIETHDNSPYDAYRLWCNDNGKKSLEGVTFKLRDDL